MSTARLFNWESLEWEEVVPGIRRRIISGDGTMIAQIFLEKGARVPLHSHHNEQVTYILSGALSFRLGESMEQEVVVRAGEVLHIPGGLPHEAVALEDTLDVDVFTPPRADWLEGTDHYFQAGGGVPQAGESE